MDKQREMSPEMVGSAVMCEDEIDLFALWQVLVRHKVLIFSAVGLFFLVAIVYAFVFATPVYKAEAILRAPLAKDVQNLNMQNLNMQKYTPKDIFTIAVENLKSISLQRQYFDTHELIKVLSSGGSGSPADVENVFKNKFHKKMIVTQDKTTPFVTVEFEGENAGFAAEWTNGLVALAEQQTVGNVLKNIAERIALSKKVIQENIVGKRKLALQRRMDQINRLEEALTIAKALKIEGNAGLIVRSGSNGISVSTGDLPLYMKGVRALQAEINALRQRKNDDSFIDGLRDLQEQLARLEAIHVSPDTIRVLRVDQQALPPDQHIKPKRTLIVLLALFGGLMFGVFAAFFVEFITKAQARGEGLSSEFRQ